MPVALVVLVHLIAGFVGRQVAVHPINHLGWINANLSQHQLISVDETPTTNTLERMTGFHVGQSINLQDFLYVNQGANFNELTFHIIYPNLGNTESTSITRNGSIITAASVTSNLVVVRVEAGTAGRSVNIRFLGVQPAL